MARLRKGNRDLIKDINRSLVLNLIKNRGPISRTDLIRQSNLSAGTISNIASSLIADGIVQEMGEGESSGGRRPVFLRLNHRAGFVIGLKLMEEAIMVAVTDLDAKVIFHQVLPLNIDSPSPSPEDVLTAVIQAIENTLAASAVERSRVVGIGIGMAGVIDGEKGICHYSPYFAWRDVDIASPIATHFDLPVYVENDVNTLTIVERWFGYGRDIPHFIVVTIGRGVGAGIVMNGQFYRGAFGGAGEFGHITMLDGDPPVTLEQLASDNAILHYAQELVAQGSDTALSSVENLNLATIVQAADEGDLLAQNLLADAGRWLGIGISTLVNLLNPQLIIVGGEGVQAGNWRLEPMREAIHKHGFNGLASSLEIVIEPLGDKTWARGAASLVLGELFKSPVLK
ncbi:ROK family transcriptional regulator [Candidatus Leptofilum sp.]|uniref:ROK family transcriptional regulator n=1 Tax=Candidatus Leptofilum sp. TaxID=3241576 RepID=UPI003B59E72B